MKSIRYIMEKVLKNPYNDHKKAQKKLFLKFQKIIAI